MRGLWARERLFVLTCCIALTLACDSYRDTRPIRTVASPDLVQRQSCQALADAESKPQEEVVLNGIAEHGRPDTLRIECDAPRSLIFLLTPQPDDLGMKELRAQWQKTTKDKLCPGCPKYNVAARFVGTLRADPGQSGRLLFLVRTADNIHRKRIRHEPKK